MTNEERDIAFIEDYLNKNLPAHERVRFEERLTQDEAFTALFERTSLLIQGIKSYHRKQSLEKVKALEATFSQRHPEPRARRGEGPPVRSLIPRTKILWIAAAISAVLIIASVFMMRSSSPDGTVLYAEYFKPYPNVFSPSLRGDADTITPVKEAFNAYNAGSYTRAALHFKKLLSTPDKTDSDNAKLYLANCYLALDSIQEAKDILTTVDGQSHVYDQARWYLALAHLKEDNTDLARTILHELAQRSSGSYPDQASAILKKL